MYRGIKEGSADRVILKKLYRGIKQKRVEFMHTFVVYILKCSDGSYYVGHTDKIEQRISQHQLGTIAGYTSQRLPVELVFMQYFATRAEALVSERKIKNWSRKKKEALIEGNWESLKILGKKKF